MRIILLAEVPQQHVHFEGNIHEKCKCVFTIKNIKLRVAKIRAQYTFLKHAYASLKK